MSSTIDDYAEPLIDAERVVKILRDCLFKEDELADGQTPPTAVIVEGILHPFGLHPERLENHRDEVTTMLQSLPKQFHTTENGGDGGWSFLNACQDANDVQWTGLHVTMDALFVLGIGLGLAAWLLPREYWNVLPGGMPYVVVKV
jgi:hypothetical protein